MTIESFGLLLILASYADALVDIGQYKTWTADYGLQTSDYGACNKKTKKTVIVKVIRS